jgi:hypothetical protein
MVFIIWSFANLTDELKDTLACDIFRLSPLICFWLNLEPFVEALQSRSLSLEESELWQLS